MSIPFPYVCVWIALLLCWLALPVSGHMQCHAKITDSCTFLAVFLWD